MNKFLCAVMIATWGLAGCASGPIRLPIVGKLSDGETAQGNVSIDMSTNVGTVSIITLNGLNCSGTYDGHDNSNTITIPVTCSNGQHGMVIATRDASGVAGTASAKLSNGINGRFLFGYVSAQQQAEFLR